MTQIERDAVAGPGDMERSHVFDGPSEERVIEGHGSQHIGREQRIGHSGEYLLLYGISDGAAPMVIPEAAVSDRDTVSGGSDAAFGIDVVDTEFDFVPVVALRDIEDQCR